MSIGNADGLCRICLNESFFYAHIYQVKLYDNILFFETINDVCQLDVDVDDGLPEFVCCSCYVKVTEFVKFKMRAHDGRAVLQSMKERMINAQSELFKNYQSNFYLKNAEDEQECGPSVKVEIKVEEESAESECEHENFEFHNENDVKLREEGFFRNDGIQEYTGFQNEMFSTPVKMEYEEGEECNTVNSDSPSVGSFLSTGERDCGLSENALGSSRSSIYSERRINDLVSYSKISPSQAVRLNHSTSEGKHFKRNDLTFKSFVGYFHEICKHSTVSKKDITRDKDKNFICIVCEMVFPSDELLTLHNSMYHSGTPSFLSFNLNFERNKKSMPKNGYCYMCNICGDTFCSAEELIWHKKSKYSGLPLSLPNCNLCGRQCSKFQSGGPPLKCQFCEKCFCYDSQLKIHERIHTGEKPYVCKICTKKFSRKCNLKSHMIHARQS